MPLYDLNTDFGRNAVADAASRRQEALQQLSLNQQYALSQQRYGLDAQDLALRRQQQLASLGMEQQRIGLQGQQIGNEQDYRNRSLAQQYGAQQQQFGLEGQRVGLEGQRNSNEQAYRQQALAQASTQFQQGLQKDYAVHALDFLQQKRQQRQAAGYSTADIDAQISGLLAGGRGTPQPQQGGVPPSNPFGGGQPTPPPQPGPAPQPAPQAQPLSASADDDGTTYGAAPTPHPAAGVRPMTDSQLIEQYSSSPNADPSTIALAKKLTANRALTPTERDELTNNGALPSDHGGAGVPEAPMLKSSLDEAHNDRRTVYEDIAQNLGEDGTPTPAQARQMEQADKNVADVSQKYQEATGKPPPSPLQAAKMRYDAAVASDKALHAQTGNISDQDIFKNERELKAAKANLDAEQKFDMNQQHLTLQKNKPSVTQAIEEATGDVKAMKDLFDQGAITQDQFQTAVDRQKAIVAQSRTGQIDPTQVPDRTAIITAQQQGNQIVNLPKLQEKMNAEKSYDKRMQMVADWKKRGAISDQAGSDLINNDPTTKMQNQIDAQVAAGGDDGANKADFWNALLKGNAADAVHTPEMQQLMQGQEGVTTTERQGKYQSKTVGASFSPSAAISTGGGGSLGAGGSLNGSASWGNSESESQRRADTTARTNQFLQQQVQAWKAAGVDTDALLRHLGEVKQNMKEQGYQGQTWGPKVSTNLTAADLQARSQAQNQKDENAGLLPPGSAGGPGGGGPGGSGPGGGAPNGYGSTVASGVADVAKDYGLDVLNHAFNPIQRAKDLWNYNPPVMLYHAAQDWMNKADQVANGKKSIGRAMTEDLPGAHAVFEASDLGKQFDGLNDHDKGVALARLAAHITGEGATIGTMVAPKITGAFAPPELLADEAFAKMRGNGGAKANAFKDAGLTPEGKTPGPIGAADVAVEKQAAASGSVPDPMAQAQAESAAQPQSQNVSGVLRDEVQRQYADVNAKVAGGDASPELLRNKADLEEAMRQLDQRAEIKSINGHLDKKIAQAQMSRQPPVTADAGPAPQLTQTLTREQALQDIGPKAASTVPASSPGFTMDDFNVKPGEGTTGPSQTVTDPMGKLRQQLIYEVRPNVLNAQTPEVRSALLADEPAAARQNLLKDLAPEQPSPWAEDYKGPKGPNLPEVGRPGIKITREEALAAGHPELEGQIPYDWAEHARELEQWKQDHPNAREVVQENANLKRVPTADVTDRRATLLNEIGPQKTQLDYGGHVNNLVKSGGSNLPEFADLPKASQAKLKALVPEAPAAVKAEAEAAGESHLFLGGPKTQVWLKKKLGPGFKTLYGNALEKDITRH